MSRPSRYDDEFLQESSQWYAPGPPEPSDTEITIDLFGGKDDVEAVGHELGQLYRQGLHVNYSFQDDPRLSVTIETETREDLEAALQHLRDTLGLVI